MMRVDDERLTLAALAVLEEVAARSEFAPQPTTRTVRLALAVLKRRALDPSVKPWRRIVASAEGPCNPFAGLWEAIGLDHYATRYQMVRQSMEGIYLLVGLERDFGSVTRFREEAMAQMDVKQQPFRGASAYSRSVAHRPPDHL